MSENGHKTIVCHQCKTLSCLGRYPEGIPSYCQAAKFPEAVEGSKKECHQPEIAPIHLATAKMLKRGGYDCGEDVRGTWERTGINK